MLVLMSLGHRDPPHIEGHGGTWPLHVMVTLFRGFRGTDARVGKELYIIVIEITIIFVNCYDRVHIGRARYQTAG
jgi:hypothetical protein